MTKTQKSIQCALIQLEQCFSEKSNVDTPETIKRLDLRFTETVCRLKLLTGLDKDRV